MFALHTWREQVAEHLQGWKERMARSGVKSVYAFLSAATLWPVAQAAQQGDWAALMTLGGVLEGVGSNLIANHIQRWKDEIDGAKRLEEEAAGNAELRQALDTLLERLAVVEEATRGLSEADRAWFQEVLRQEVKKLGSGLNLQVGERGIGIGGSVQGAILNTGTLLFNIYQSPPGDGRLSEEDFRRILGEYLEWVYEANRRARLYGLESFQTARGKPVRSLEEVFVPLTLRKFNPPSRDEVEALAQKMDHDPWAEQRAFVELARQRRTEGNEVPLSGILTASDRVAIIGGAGSGKSTLLKYMAYWLALHALEETPPPFALPEGRDVLVPLLIPLRYYPEYLCAVRESPRYRLEDPRAGTLAGFIPWYLKHRSPALELSEDFFDRLLLGGGCLLMLDGLDEVVTREERGKVREEVERIAHDVYPDNIILVTAREAGYRENAVFGDDFLRLDIQPLTEEQVEHIVRNWCTQLYSPDRVDDEVQDIMEAVREINERYRRQRLPPLFYTPLMATMVVSVKWGETELPRERAKLYEAAVRVILQAQYLPEDEARQELVNWGGPWEEQREWLSHLALEMHRGGQGSAVIPEERLREVLSPILEEERLDQFIRAVRERGGLLEERAGLFQFVHLTFQEFLAARLLAKQRHSALKSLVPHIGDPWWREVFLLLYGFAKMDYAPYAEEFLEWLSNVPDADDTTRMAGLELAGAAVLEIERPDPKVRTRQAERLLHGIRTLDAPAILRAKGGDTLAALGDPRFDPDHWYLPREPLLGFVPIPKGEFIMGSDPQKDPQALNREQPQHRLYLPTYYIARYPATVAQFRAFVEESGYKPHNPDSLRGTDNHPVVWVTWLDALVYAQWLDERLRDLAKEKVGEVQSEVEQDFWRGLAERRYRVTLPSEAEWEKAARGGLQIPHSPVSNLQSLVPNPLPDRIYPWGNGSDPNRTNSAETGIGAPSAVGCFPCGVSPYGVEEMSGNVWEWTRSLRKEYKYDPNDGRERLDAPLNIVRVLRGGSFHSTYRGVRCSLRYWFHPDLVNWSNGFRIVVSTFATVH